MTAGSCFSGLGGFDLGLALAGFAMRWQAEIDPMLRAHLAARWSQATQFASADDAVASAPSVDLIYAELPHHDWALAVEPARLAVRSARWLVIEGAPTSWASMRAPGDVVMAAGWRATYRVAQYVTGARDRRSAVRQRVVLVAAADGDPTRVCDESWLDASTPIAAPTAPGISIEGETVDAATLEALRGFPVGWTTTLDSSRRLDALRAASSPSFGLVLGTAIARQVEAMTTT